MKEIIIYLFPVITLILGAFLQFMFSEKSDKRKQKYLLKTDAYTDFLSAIAGLANSQRCKHIDKEFEFNILLTNAKAKIAVYGSDKVISKIAEFYREGAKLNDANSIKIFISLISEMRNENHKNSNSKFNELSHLLFGENIE